MVQPSRIARAGRDRGARMIKSDERRGRFSVNRILAEAATKKGNAMEDGILEELLGTQIDDAITSRLAQLDRILNAAGIETVGKTEEEIEAAVQRKEPPWRGKPTTKTRPRAISTTPLLIRSRRLTTGHRSGFGRMEP